MKEKGFGGVLLVDAGGAEQEKNRAVPAGPKFGSPAWVKLYTHALRVADRLGLEITLNIMSGWNLGGPDVLPEEASKILTWTRKPLEGGSEIAVQLPAPVTKNGFYRQIAVEAYPLRRGSALQPLPGLGQRSAAEETGFSMSPSDWMLDPGERPGRGNGLSQLTANDQKSPGSEENSASEATQADTSIAEVRDVSAFVSKDGLLKWTAPPGSWEVLRIGYTDSGAMVSTSSDHWKGLAVDYMSREAFDTYWNRSVQPLLFAAKPFHSLKYLAEDSWELGGTNWTEGFAEEFQRRRGYDPLPWLPVLAGRVLDSRDTTARFLTDVRRTVADLIAANHFARFAERAAEAGLGVEAESGGPHGAPIDALQNFGRSAVPQTEFWAINPHRSTDTQRFFVKEAASAANIYGKHYAAAEGETSINRQWDESLATDLKPSFDMAVTEGLNRLVWHEFTSSPASTGLPGQEYFAGTHINPKVTWWNAGTPFFNYLNRVQFMMQQGVPVNDVLYFYGDNIPAFVRPKADDPAHALPGYDYDVTNEDALLNTIALVPGFRSEPWAVLTAPSGARWSALVLPESRRISVVALERIGQLARQGAVIIGLRPLSPSGKVTPAAQAHFDALTAEIWGNTCDVGHPKAYGKGQVFCTTETHAAMLKIGSRQGTTGISPDVSLPAGETSKLKASFDSALDYVHRRYGSTDIYFLRNGSAIPVHQEVAFRAAGDAELWDPVSGTMQTASTVKKLPKSTQFTLDLPPFGSIFVVFTGQRGRYSVATAAQRSQTLPMSDPWSLQFQPGRGAPADPLPVPELTSWSGWPEQGIRYFSGTATYRSTVVAPRFQKGDQVFLQFNDVREIAHVRVNGLEAGTVWAKPLTLRLDKYLKPGKNILEIEVTNLWPNRIIGDLQPGATERITSTNIAAYKADSPLLPSGLIGPLSWRIVHK